MGSAGSVEVVRVRVEPCRAATYDGWMFYVDWKNVGTRPVTFIEGRFNAFDATGAPIAGIPRIVTNVYAALPGRPGVGPGETHVTPEHQGFMTPELVGVVPVTAAVEITAVG